ncbi:MAG: hypothetical protein ABII82_05755, partial [Verrucomicrobiota bacterium]
RPAAPQPAPAPAPVPAAPAAPATSDSQPAQPAAPAAADSPAAAKPGGKKIGLIVAAVVALALIGIGVKVVLDSSAAKAEAAQAAAEQAAQEAEIAKLREIRLSALNAEVARDPMSFKNSNYSFEVTDKGFIRKLANASNQVLIDSAGAVNLQGSYVTPEGRRVWFYAGGVGNSTYTASVQKGILGADIAFTVKITHPRFELTQVITCLEKSVKVEADFTPIKLQDERGSISAIYAIQLWPAALNAREEVKVIVGAARYPTQAGPLTLTYGGDAWQVGEKPGKQLVNIGDTGTAFYFTDVPESDRRKLTYEIALP